MYNAPSVFVIFAVPFWFVTVPEIASPPLPEFVISRLFPEFVTVPFISNILFEFVKSVSPFVLDTFPSIKNPPSPLLFIASPDPLFITLAP